MTGLFNGLMALAQAEGTPQQDPAAGCMQMGFLMVVIIAIFYFLVIRPQRKQQLEHQRFLDRLKEGDRVITTGGILGRIVGIEPDVVTIDVGDRTRVRVLRTQISRSQLGAGDGDASADRGASDGDSGRGGSRKRK